MAVNHLSYLELPAGDIATLQSFYGDLFGWTYQSWGEDYATVHGSGLEIGFNADPSHRSKAPLCMVETDRIEEMESQVRKAGGTITVPTFEYPGGRRFHFVDPSGNELAVFQPNS
jgi:predicted enzyme related to lactoylglutathione lyase